MHDEDVAYRVVLLHRINVSEGLPPLYKGNMFVSELVLTFLRFATWEYLKRTVDIERVKGYWAADTYTRTVLQLVQVLFFYLTLRMACAQVAASDAGFTFISSS